MATQIDFQSHPALKQILSSFGQGIAIFDSNRTLLFTNDEMRRVTGSRGGTEHSLTELLKRHKLRDERGVPIAYDDFPIERAFRGEESRDITFEYIAPDSSHVWLLVSCVVIRDESEEPEYIVTTVTDISARRDQEHKLRFMVEAAKILSITQDVHQRLTEKARLAVPSLADWCAIDILEQSGALERVVIVHNDPEMISLVRTIEERYPSDPENPRGAAQVIRTMSPLFVATVDDEILSGFAHSPEHLAELRRLNLSSLMIIPIDARGKALGSMTLAYAESGRRYTGDDLKFFRDFGHHLGVILDNAGLYDEIKKRDKAKDHFLASLSHELRNPLAPIRSTLEMIEIKGVPADIREEINVITHQFEHMSTLLQDLLDVSRFSSGKIVLTRTPVDLLEIIVRTLRAAEPLMRRRDLTLETKLPNAQVCINADATRIEQAIMNLLANAAKFTSRGGHVRIALESAGSDAIVTVRDTGSGITPRDLPRIFDMYYQGSGGSEINGGLGIGLPLAKSIIEQHGGTILAESAGAGFGSTFMLRVPLSNACASPKSTPPPFKQQGLRVLIVDDNAPAADSLAKLLNKIGMRASCFYAARDALAYDTSEYDIILLDIGMPEMDGYELVQKLRERGVTRPIVALTGYGLADDKRRAQEAGFTAHLTKPVGLKEIRELFSSLATA